MSTPTVPGSRKREPPVQAPDEHPWGRMASFTAPDGNGLMLLAEDQHQEGRHDHDWGPRAAEDRVLAALSSGVRREVLRLLRVHRLEAAPLAEVRDWLHPYERFWRERLKVLGELLDRLPDDGTT
ncbi:hypothetical protein ABT063_22425 [Streptomyces sp. NPDC002838]|uniref:hypothetical protein n=1 Tax=Streptomyces sp. NPDC002838 TaxID=3154436 RepID=UPI00331D5FBE